MSRDRGRMERPGTPPAVVMAALLLCAGAGVVGAAGPVVTTGAGARCEAAVRHPIEVRVRPLDPVRRGATVRLEVRASARVPLTGAEIRLASSGGAVLASAPRLALGRMAPEREAAGTFAVAVPPQGHRFLVQFLVTGEGPRGVLTRGAVYNLLPDGPQDAGREVTTSGGERVIEFAAMRSGR